MTETLEEPIYEGWLFPEPDSKHEDVILDFNYENYKLSVLWGSVSSGKTVSSCQAWAGLVKGTPKHYPLAMIGKTELTLEANVIDPLMDFLGEDDCYKRGNVAWIYGHKVRLYGANDAKSRSKIQGKSLHAWYGDEVTTWPEDFFMMALSRLRVGKAKAIMTMNPEGPYHYFHTQIIERADQPEIRAKLYHFTMDDNHHLPQDYKDWISSMYKPGTVWHRRWILGEWAMAEGAIYDFFAPDPKYGYVVLEVPTAFDRYHVGIDYAESSVNVMLLLGRSEGIWYVLREVYWDAKKQGRQKTNTEYSQDFWKLVEDKRVRTDCDPGGGGAGLINQLRRDYMGKGYIINQAMNAVVPGIQAVTQLMTAGKLKIHISCKNTIQELSNYVWDSKAQEKGEDKPLKVNDHCCDALRYAVMRATAGTAIVRAKPAGM
jgi:PBSX family phage terminase large subunit